MQASAKVRRHAHPLFPLATGLQPV